MHAQQGGSVGMVALIGLTQAFITLMILADLNKVSFRCCPHLAHNQGPAHQPYNLDGVLQSTLQGMGCSDTPHLCGASSKHMRQGSTSHCTSMLLASSNEDQHLGGRTAVTADS